MTADDLRARALDATAQALNAGGYWLPTEGQAAVVDAVLAVLQGDRLAPCAAVAPGDGPTAGQPCRRPEGHGGAHETFIRTGPAHGYGHVWIEQETCP
ncbi:hypothetical protein ACFWJT_15685 [Streptomyces sp. NPDC127069]|uniref:hypothetical protein n=1 Tax=Streptomyces sp. NPDC127069 TaxID=3347128 RepID=UPI00364B6569